MPTESGVEDTDSADPLSAFEPQFSEAVESNHRQIDTDRYENIYVIGDVHGCIAELRALWDRLDVGTDDLAVFVGDLVRKGPASVEVVEFVHSRPNAVTVRGNNEAKIVHDRIDTSPFEPVADIIESFPLAVSWDSSLVVHGGVDPRQRLRAHEPTDLLEMRSIPTGNGYDGPFWFERYETGPRVFFGHTVLEAPFVSDTAVGLDTGCVYGGALTAYDCRRDETVSVPAEQTYQQRSADKILSVDC
jgi:serine/threonine protein phosphatase 1